MNEQLQLRALSKDIDELAATGNVQATAEALQEEFSTWGWKTCYQTARVLCNELPLVRTERR